MCDNAAIKRCPAQYWKKKKKKKTTMYTHMPLLDFLILLVTFLCIIHSHSSDRRPPIRNTLTLSISHLVSTRKPSHLSAQQPSKIHNKLYISLILIMHDIELNPGPRSPKFPCGICHNSVLPRLLLQGAAPCPLFVTPCPFEKAEMTPCPFDKKKH